MYQGNTRPLSSPFLHPAPQQPVFEPLSSSLTELCQERQNSKGIVFPITVTIKEYGGIKAVTKSIGGALWIVLHDVVGSISHLVWVINYATCTSHSFFLMSLKRDIGAMFYLSS